MHEGQPERMQRLARQSGSGRAAIQRIADQRMADRRHVHADLVRAAGFERAAHRDAVGMTVQPFDQRAGGLAGMARQDLSERDQKAAKESFLAFKELVTRFPESRYAPDARQRMNYVVNSLAQYEVHVARYYYNRGAYLAAINRSQLALADYREVPALEEALYIMVQSYDKLGMNDLRDDARRVLTTNYPKSEYLARGFRSKDDPWWKVW